MRTAALPFLVLFVGIATSHDGRGASDEPAPKDTGVEVIVTFHVEGSMRVRLLDNYLDLVREGGRVRVLARDIQKIEFASSRIPEDQEKKIEAALADLKSLDASVRQKAGARLLDFKELAYPRLKEVVSQKDPETFQQAEMLVKQLTATLPAGDLTPRTSDVVTTADGSVVGIILASHLCVSGRAIGQVCLPLNELRGLRLPSIASVDTDLAPVPDAPTTLTSYRKMAGQTFAFKVTGAATGNVWGTDVYTLDSELAAVAVHAGVVAVGKTGIIRVQIVGQYSTFAGTTRNAITSKSYGPSAAFRILK